MPDENFDTKITVREEPAIFTSKTIVCFYFTLALSDGWNTLLKPTVSKQLSGVRYNKLLRQNKTISTNDTDHISSFVIISFPGMCYQSGQEFCLWEFRDGLL